MVNVLPHPEPLNFCIDMKLTPLRDFFRGTIPKTRSLSQGANQLKNYYCNTAPPKFKIDPEKMVVARQTCPIGVQ